MGSELGKVGLEHLPPEAALARNLLCPDYVEILCGTLEHLAGAFADIDAVRRRRDRPAEVPGDQEATIDTPDTASASLPKPDRIIVRTEALGGQILAAARSRAPRLTAVAALR